MNDQRTHLLTRFKKGDAVVISGRLTIHPKTRRLAVLVNESPPVRATDDEEMREIYEWNSARRFQAHANVVGGNRWAKRAGWQR